MKKLLVNLKALHNDESGQDLIEYALVASLIALASISTMQTVATDINSVFTAIGGKLTAAIG